MGDIKDKVAIIGMGCTQFGELWDKGVEDLIVDACSEALEDAGVDLKDIQAAWYGTSYDFEFRESGSTSQPLAHALKTDYIPITRVENACATGGEIIRNAAFAVAAGMYDIVLCCGIEKLKDVGYAGLPVTKSYPDPGNIEPQVLPVAYFANYATRYFHRYGLSYEEGKRTLAQIEVKNHHNGVLSPKAHFHNEITVEQAVKAPMICYPLGLFDCCGVSDGGAAAILTRADLAPNFRKDYVLIKGLGLAIGGRQGSYLPDYDFTHVEETVQAAQQAYAQAGITNPRKEIDLAEVHDCFSITELLIYEDLGFSPRGRAKEDVEAGTFTVQGELSVNPDGGLKCFGHPISASGIRMMYEVYKQLQGKAGPRQLKKADLGLTHSLGGYPTSHSVSVSILGR